MRILFLDAYFEPDQIAFTHLEKDLLEGLVKEGHYVEVVCPTPTRGGSEEIIQKYKKIKTEDLYDGHVHVTRFSAPREGKNPLIRALRYLWCNLRTYQIGKKAKNIDVIFSNSTPPTQGITCSLVAKQLSKVYRRKVPFVYNLQDVFPDSLVNAKMTKKGSIAWKIGRIIENYTYKQSDQIIVISLGIKQNIIKKGVPNEKIKVISNWIDLNNVRPVDRFDNQLFDEFQIDRSKFVVLYAGNLGEAQGADIIIETAKELISEKRIQFVIIGGGPKYKEIKERIKKEKVSNILIVRLRSQDQISDVYSMGDVALITCKPGTGYASLPSKTWSIMACNTQIIASFDIDSDLADVLNDSGAGYCIEPGNPKTLEDAILTAFKNWRNIDTKTTDCRSYALCAASKDNCVKKYIDTFQNVVEK